MQFRPLGDQTQHSSYPDLVSFRSQQATGSQQDTNIRRSSSLQDVSSLNDSDIDSMFQSKKLKPILRGSDAKNAAKEQQHDKGVVKFGQKEVRLIKDPPLPPIEGAGSLPSSKSALSCCDSAGRRNGDDLNLSFGHSPQPHRRFGPERPPEIFPRGQPVEVKKPMTPTYDDYPEAYWELRSPTVQDPSDLKEDMIDRDRYRLQQISSLRLRAMNREVAANRLDSYRKWQQQLQENSPPLGSSTKQDSARGTATPAAALNGPVVSARAGKQQSRMSLPIQNHTLAVDAKSISPSTNPTGTQKRSKSNNKNDGSENAGQSNDHVTDDDLRRRAKIEAAARGTIEKQSKENEVRPLKAAVVNLCMDPDRKSNSPTSDVYTGIRKVMMTTRPQSDKIRTQVFGPGQHQGQQNAYGNHGPPGSVGMASNTATLGSPDHHLQRVPSAPAGTPPTSSGVVTNGGGTSTNVEGNTNANGSKLILKKFNRLQVFGEKSAAVENTVNSSSMNPWDVTLVNKPASEKTPYLPQNRPPTYKLDMRNYPPRDRGLGSRDVAEEEVAGGGECGGGYALLASERGGVPIIPLSPHKAEATTSLNFRFRNGEVIVSRQGKKPSNET